MKGSNVNKIQYTWASLGLVSFLNPCWWF